MNHNQHFFPEYVPYNENHNNITYGRNKNNNVMINQHFNRRSHQLPWQGNPARSHQCNQKNHISVYWQNRHRQLYPNYDNHTNSTIQDQQNYRSNTKLPRKLSCQIKNQHKEKAKVEVKIMLFIKSPFFELFSTCQLNISPPSTAISFL